MCLALPVEDVTRTREGKGGRGRTVGEEMPGTVFALLLKEVWGPQQVQETHYLRVFMASLRRKIEADPAQPKYLLTEQGVGYRFAGETDA